MTFGNTMPKVRMQTASLRMKTTFCGVHLLDGVPSCFGFSMSNPHFGRQCMTCRSGSLAQADCAGMRSRRGGLLQQCRIVPAECSAVTAW